MKRQHTNISTVVVLLLSLLLPHLTVVAATEPSRFVLTVDGTNESGAVLGVLHDNDPGHARLGVKNRHKFWTNIVIQQNSNHLTPTALTLDDFGGFYARFGAIGPDAEAVWDAQFTDTNTTLQIVTTTPGYAYSNSLTAGMLNILYGAMVILDATGSSTKGSLANIAEAIKTVKEERSMVAAAAALVAYPPQPKAFITNFYAALTDEQQATAILKALSLLGLTVMKANLQQLLVIPDLVDAMTTVSDEISAIVHQSSAGSAVFETVPRPGDGWLRETHSLNILVPRDFKFSVDDGQGRVRVLVDGKLVIDTQSDCGSLGVTNLGFGDHTYQVEYRAEAGRVPVVSYHGWPFVPVACGAPQGGSTGITPAGTVPPKPPTNIQIAAANSQSINLTWQSNSSDTSRFKVYSDGKVVSTATDASPAAQVRISDLPNAPTHCFTVVAVNGAGESPPSNDVCTNPPAAVITATQPVVMLLPSPTSQPTASPTPIPTATPTTVPLPTATYQNISFSYSPVLASKVTGTTVPQGTIAGLGVPYPAYTELKLENYPVSQQYRDPTIQVFAVDSFKAAYAGGTYNALYDDTVSGINTLKSLVTQRPDLTTTYPPYGTLKGAGSGPSQPLPYLPPINAGLAFSAKMAYLDSQGGGGVRYLTTLWQQLVPLGSDSIRNGMFYTYQGLTSDGKYYIAATFPVSVNIPFAPAPSGTDANATNSYNQDVVNKLSQTDNSMYTPNLDLLDALIKSIKVTTPLGLPATPTTAPLPSLRNVDWAYAFAHDPDLTVRSEPAICGAGELDIWVQYKGNTKIEGHPLTARIRYGDLEGNGMDDAVIDLVQACTGGGIPTSLIYRMTPNGPKIAAFVPITNASRAGGLPFPVGKDAQIRNGQLEVTEQIYNSSDTNCCPSGGTRITQYRLQGNQLVEIGSRVEAAPTQAPPTTQPVAGNLSPPSGLVASRISPTSIQLNWSFSSFAGGFRIYECTAVTSGGKDCTKLVSSNRGNGNATPQSGVSATTFPGLVPNSRHCYAVTAFNDKGESAQAGPVCA